MDDKVLRKTINWDGEKKGFRMWQNMIMNRCRQKGGLVKRIALDKLPLDVYLQEQGAQEEEYEVANCWLYGFIGEPLLDKSDSIAYSLLDGQEPGQGLAVLQDFQVYFDGRTMEEVEDIDDQYRRISFQSEGVQNLASYLALHRSYVQRLNQSGAVISRTTAFRRVLKQLPQKYSVIRQSLAAQL
jgi:hypothetical protein